MYYQQALIFTDIEHSTGAMDSKQMSTGKHSIGRFGSPTNDLTATATSGNLGSVLKPQGEAAAKVKVFTFDLFAMDPFNEIY